MEEGYITDYSGNSWKRERIPAEQERHLNVQPEWTRLFDEDDNLLYEGHLMRERAFGSGTSYYPDGRICQEGIFGAKGLVCGRVYYPNGQVRFEGTFQYNDKYGPNWPIFGAWYSQDGELKYYGLFKVILRGGNGQSPYVAEPEGFGRIPEYGVMSGHVFGDRITDPRGKYAPIYKT